MSVQVVSHCSNFTKSRRYWSTHDPEVARNTTEIEYVLVPRMQIHNLISLAVGVENSFWCIRLHFRSHLSTFDLKGSS